MLSKKRQQQYFLQRWSSILHHFEQFARRTNADDLHRIRVELKKIRAMLFLHEETGGSVSKREHQLVRSIFKQAGKIRDAQISAHLVKEAGVVSIEFFTEHRKTVATESRKFVKLFNGEANHMVKENTKVWKSLKNISSGELEKLFAKLWLKVQKSYVPKLVQKELHDSRKIIKRIVYIHSMLKNKDIKKFGLEIEQMKMLEENVGNWNDTKVTAMLLKKISGSAVQRKKLTAISTDRLEKVQKTANSLF